MASGRPGELRLRRWAAALVAVFGLLVGGTWTTVRFTTDYLLVRDAAMNARDWAQFLAANVGDLEQIAAGEQPGAASMAFFDAARKSGLVFRYVIFNRDGYSQLVSDRNGIALVDLSEFSLQAARAMKSGNALVDFKEADKRDLPAYYAEAYVPVRAGNHPVAVVAAYVDQTEHRSMFYQAFVAGTLALCTLIAMSFGVPAVAWYRRTEEKQRADRRIRYLAHHDSLTGLHNRAWFVERLEEALVNAADRPGGIGVHFIDVDRFKDVNDTLGHDGGDALLKAIAERLGSVAGPGDLVARVGGDEFVVAQLDVTDKTQAEELGRRLWRALGVPVLFGDQEIDSTVSIGTAVSPTHGDTLSRLLKSADLALYDAKANGRNCVRLFSAGLDAAAQARLRLERTIREATERETFHLVYQPIFELGSRRLTGFEALLRLRDADGESIPPSAFIPVAEEMRLIGRIGAWALRQACRTAASWPDNLRVAVNLSPTQFDSGDISAVVTAGLRESGLAPARLELEITEALLLANDARNLAALAQLKAMGIAIVMDDFGTGYSSLSYLWKFPFDKIKIDRSFTQGLGSEGARVATVVKTIIALGRELRMSVTVEGVETAEQLRFLEAAEAQQAQGFWFAKPMSAEDAAIFILDDERRRGAIGPPPAGGKPVLQLVK